MTWFWRRRGTADTDSTRQNGSDAGGQARPCVVEPLECRQLLAAACLPDAAAPDTTEPVAASASSSSSSLQLLAAKPKQPVPTKLRAKPLSTSSIRVTWNDTKGEKKYQLYRREVGKGNKWKYIEKLKKNQTKFVDEKLDDGQRYEYRIRGVGNSGKSKFSKVVSATTKREKPQPPPPNPDPDPNPNPNPGHTLDLKWTSVASAPVGRHEAIGVAAQGKLYAFGGFTPNLNQHSDAHAYDPKTNEWQRIADAPEPMTHGSAAVDGDMIYVAGFFEGEDHHGDGSRNVWVYDISENKWSAGPTLPKRQGAAVLVKAGRNLHFFGGLEPGRVANAKEHWVLDLDGGRKWTSAKPMPNPKDHLAAVEVGGKIYAIGGEHLGNDITMNQSDVHVYDPKKDTWQKRASLPIPWSHHTSSTVVVNGRILVIAGETNGRVHLARVMQYDPGTDRWTELNGVPSTRKSPIAGVIDDMIVVYGGEGRGPEATTWVARI